MCSHEMAAAPRYTGVVDSLVSISTQSRVVSQDCFPRREEWTCDVRPKKIDVRGKRPDKTTRKA